MPGLEDAHGGGGASFCPDENNAPNNASPRKVGSPKKRGEKRKFDAHSQPTSPAHLPSPPPLHLLQRNKDDNNNDDDNGNDDENGKLDNDLL